MVDESKHRVQHWVLDHAVVESQQTQRELLQSVRTSQSLDTFWIWMPSEKTGVEARAHRKKLVVALRNLANKTMKPEGKELSVIAKFAGRDSPIHVVRGPDRNGDE